MKLIYFASLLSLGLLLTNSKAHADNLNVTVNHAMDGGNTGEIYLSIAGGMAPYDILWTGPGGFTSTSTVLTSLPPGTYHVVVNDMYCGQAEMDVVIESKSTSIDQIESDFVKIYPNPTSDDLNIQTVDYDKYEIHVFNVLGQKVIHSIMEGNHTVFDLSKLNTGVYIIKIQSDKGVYSKKITKL